MKHHFFSVETPGGIKRLDEGGGVTDEQGVTGGTGQHANRGEPNIRGALGRIPTVADAKHMG